MLQASEAFKNSAEVRQAEADALTRWDTMVLERVETYIKQASTKGQTETTAYLGRHDGRISDAVVRQLHKAGYRTSRTDDDGLLVSWGHLGE